MAGGIAHLFIHVFIRAFDMIVARLRYGKPIHAFMVVVAMRD